MKLVFRLGEKGFSIAIEETVEILEALPGWLNRETAETRRYQLGEMIHRGTVIPVYDLRRRMQLPFDGRRSDSAILVVSANEGSFALTVDGIDGIFPEREFVDYQVPFQFVDGVAPAYDRIDIWGDEPLVALAGQTLSHCWEAA